MALSTTSTVVSLTIVDGEGNPVGTFYATEIK